MSCAQWANQHYYLSSESAYTEGKWETQPFQVAILNAMGNDDIVEVNLIKSARVGYSQMLKAAMAYFIEHKRRNCILWQPTNDKSDEFTKEHVDPMIRDVKVLRDLFPWLDKKHKYNTVSYKLFTNSKQLHLKGGNSGANYREKSVDVAIYDELSSFDANIDKEGDAVTLGDKRIEGAPFPKSIRGSTPKEKATCQITMASDSADEYFKRYLPCPHCGHEQVLVWGGPDENFGIKFDKGKPETASYLCEHCAVLIDNDELSGMDEKGVWRSQNGLTTIDGLTFNDAKGQHVAPPHSATFHIWAAYSPWTTWAKIARDFIKAVKNVIKWRAWTNTTEGQAWEEDGQRVKADNLYMRREHYPAKVPDDVVVLVGGVDQQDDRLECSVWGYGGTDGTESWLITHDIFYGNPGRKELWNRLRDYLFKQWRNTSGVLLRPAAAGIDTGGHYTTMAYKFCKNYEANRFYALKGSNQRWQPLASRPTKGNKEKVNLFSVGTDTAKASFFGCLKVENPGPGYVHFPIGDPKIDEEYFEQLTGEALTTQYKDGRPVKVYKAMRPRVEALDCKVYADTALEILKPNFKILRRKIRSMLTEPSETDNAVERKFTTKSKKKVIKKRSVRKVSKGGFVGRY